MIKDQYKVNKGSEYDYHLHEIAESADHNPLFEVMNRLEHKYHYRAEESAMYHPQTKGVVKMRNNGTVEMFATEDTGIRMDPKGQVINIFANHSKSHLHHMTEWISGDSKSYVKKNRLMKTEGTTHIHSGKDMTIVGKENLHILIDKNENITIGGNSKVIIKGNASLHVHGNVDAKIDQHATIEVAKDVDVYSGRNIDMVAEGYMRIDGSRIYVGMDIIK